jgi:hypothetical protein
MFCYSITKTENNNLEQRYAIKFCVKLGDSATDTYETIQKAFGNDSLSRAQVFRWHKEFVNGREMAHATVSKTEESSHEQIKNQDSGHFLRFSPVSS